MIRLGVSGALGRMGRTILNLAFQDKAFRVTAAWESPSCDAIGQSFSAFSNNPSAKKVKLTIGEIEEWKKTDVVIEVNSPKATLKDALFAQKTRTPMIVATTGFSQREYARLKKTARHTALLIAPNMSLGANLLYELAAEVSRRLAGYDAEIIEAHHNRKKDAPSGTARRLAAAVAAARRWPLSSCAVYGRKGLTGARRRREIGIHTVRAGSIVGVHTALFAGEGESLEITHRAQNREAFARGALLAACFLARRRKGLYGMKDVLRDI